MARLVTAVLCVVATAGCAHGAMVRCGDAPRMHVESGYVNTANWEIGQVVGLDTDAKSGQVLGRLHFDPKTLTTKKSMSKVEKVRGGLSVKYAAALKPAEKTRVTDAITKASRVKLMGIEHVSADKAVDLLAKTDGVRHDVVYWLSGGDDHKAMIITGVVRARKAAIALDHAGGSVKVGKRRMSVSYECSDTLSHPLSGSPLLFEATFVSYDPKTRKLSKGKPVDVSPYDFHHTELGPGG